MSKSSPHMRGWACGTHSRRKEPQAALRTERFLAGRCGTVKAGNIPPAGQKERPVLQRLGQADAGSGIPVQRRTVRHGGASVRRRIPEVGRV